MLPLTLNPGVKLFPVLFRFHIFSLPGDPNFQFGIEVNIGGAGPVLSLISVSARQF
jgi:hypothetical protein